MEKYGFGKRYDECMNAFLKVRDALLESQDNFALAKAFSKPVKWYGEHSTAQVIKILRAEANE